MSVLLVDESSRAATRRAVRWRWLIRTTSESNKGVTQSKSIVDRYYTNRFLALLVIWSWLSCLLYLLLAADIFNIS